MKRAVALAAALFVLVAVPAYADDTADERIELPEYLSVLDADLPLQSSGVDAPDAVPIPQTGVVDPLAPTQPEYVPEVQQPNAAAKPEFIASLGWFGSGFARATSTDTPQRVSVAAGADRVYVLSARQRRVFVYDAKSLAAAGPGSFAVGLTSVSGIAYHDSPTGAEVYVLGVSGGAGTVHVYRTDGTLKRTVHPAAGTATTWSGIDVAWGELWLTRAAKGTNGSADDPDVAGQEIAIFDAQTGALKGRSQQPLGDLRPALSPRSWWDLSIVPEYAAAFVDRRAFSRLPVVPSVPLPDSLACTGGTSTLCGSAGQEGTDAVWGMRWLLELVSYASVGGHRPVEEFSIEHRKIETSLLDIPLTVELPGLYLVPKRTWTTQQQAQGAANTVSDIAYNNREVRIDWVGPLSTSDWLRGDKCLTYVVSDADIFVAGDKGERWYEPARNFEYIDFFLDGVRLERRTTVDPANPASVGDFCLNTRLYDNWPDLLNGAHTIELKARVAGKDISIDNPELKIDNLNPGGTMQSVGEYSRGTTIVAMTATDDHSGVTDWQIQASRAGGAWQTVCSGRSTTGEPGVQSCGWDTTRTADGPYRLRGLVRDRSSDAERFTPTTTTIDDGNSGATQNEVQTTVDNTPPNLSNFAPALGQAGNEAVTAMREPVRWTQTDALSGMASTTISYNDAPDGGCTGAWHPIGSSSATGDTRVEWDTTGLPAGLICLRALASDRAGNERSFEWQAIVPATRAVPAQTSATTPGYGYGSFSIGRDRQTTWGTEAVIIAPPFNPPREAGEDRGGRHTLSYANVGNQDANRSLQTGIATESRCPPHTMPADGSGDRWAIYAELFDNTGSGPFSGSNFWGCADIVPQHTLNPLYNYRTEVDRAGQGRAFWATWSGSGPWSSDHPVMIGEAPEALRGDQPSTYRMNVTDDGFPRSQITGEVYGIGRQMGGTFLGAGFKPSADTPGSAQGSAYRAPVQGERDDGRGINGYAVTDWNTVWSSFCAYGPVPAFDTGSCGP